MELIGPYLAACLLLVAAGTAKAFRPADTARALAATVPIRLSMLVPLVRVGAGAELLVGAAGLALPSPWTAWPVALSYLGFAAYVGVVLVRGGPLASCGCFATPDVPVTRVHVALDLVLGASAAVVAAAVPTQWLPALLSGQPWAGVPLGATSLLGAWLAFLAMGRLAELGAARRRLGITRGPVG